MHVQLKSRKQVSKFPDFPGFPGHVVTLILFFLEKILLYYFQNVKVLLYYDISHMLLWPALFQQFKLQQLHLIQSAHFQQTKCKYYKLRADLCYRLKLSGLFCSFRVCRIENQTNYSHRMNFQPLRW